MIVWVDIFLFYSHFFFFLRDSLNVQASLWMKENYLNWFALQLYLSCNCNSSSLLTCTVVSPVAFSNEACYSGFQRSSWSILHVCFNMGLSAQAFREWCSEVFHTLHFYTLRRVSDENNADEICRYDPGRKKHRCYAQNQQCCCPCRKPLVEVNHTAQDK